MADFFQFCSSLSCWSNQSLTLPIEHHDVYLAAPSFLSFHIPIVCSLFPLFLFFHYFNRSTIHFSAILEFPGYCFPIEISHSWEIQAMFWSASKIVGRDGSIQKLSLYGQNYAEVYIRINLFECFSFSFFDCHRKTSLACPSPCTSTAMTTILRRYLGSFWHMWALLAKLLAFIERREPYEVSEIGYFFVLWSCDHQHAKMDIQWTRSK